MPSTLATLVGQKSMCLKSDMVLVFVVGDLGGFVELVTCVTLGAGMRSWWIRGALKMGVIRNKWPMLVCGTEDGDRRAGVDQLKESGLGYVDLANQVGC